MFSRLLPISFPDVAEGPSGMSLLLPRAAKVSSYSPWRYLKFFRALLRVDNFVDRVKRCKRRLLGG
jgi:hypothetical protein